MDYQGTISRGIRAPIIKKGDDLVKIVADSVVNASKEHNFPLCFALFLKKLPISTLDYRTNISKALHLFTLFFEKSSRTVRKSQ